MKILSFYKTDKKAVTEGIWRSLGHAPEELLKKESDRKPVPRIKVARFGNPVAAEVYRQTEVELRESINSPDKEMAADAQAELMSRVAASLLTDWDGMEDEGGLPLPFSADLALEAVRNDDFRAVVLTCAQDSLFYREAEVKKMSGNSRPV